MMVQHMYSQKHYSLVRERWGKAVRLGAVVGEGAE